MRPSHFVAYRSAYLMKQVLDKHHSARCTRNGSIRGTLMKDVRALYDELSISYYRTLITLV
jgi:hypothetical protein